MSSRIFVIKNTDGIVAFYDDLEQAKKELIDIFNLTFDFKYECYEINVYDLVNHTYVMTDAISYRYQYGEFVIDVKINHS